MEPTITLEPVEHWLAASSRPDAKAFLVMLNGKQIGKVEQTWPTMERRTPGRRYVNARWTRRRPAWGWESAKPGVRTAGLWRETRKAAVASVVQAWERED